jgi:type III pantothenate kinase
LPRWLLVGNSRWHWAESGPAGLCIRHESPQQGARSLALGLPPRAWAAVGPLAPDLALDPGTRLVTRDLPLLDLPDWLGVDRALAGWLAWRELGGAVLVADAGTVLSLTRIDRHARFAGGRLMAGLALQLRAMAAGTAALPELPAAGSLAGLLGSDAWPAGTQAAMVSGVAHALAAALVQALRELAEQDRGIRLVLSGGDAPLLLPLCRAMLGAEQAGAIELLPDLALRAVVERGGPQPWSSPRSART